MRHAPRLVALASLLALTVFASIPSALAAVPAGVSPMKARQLRMLADEPMRERRESRERAERMRELRQLARKLHASGRTSMVVRGERARPDLLDEDARLGLPRPLPERLATPASARAAQALLPNVRCNDPSGDLLSPGGGPTVIEGQCETAIARWNNDLIAAWNDGKGYDDGTGQTQGWATSTDGGTTWTDHGTFPIPAAYSSTWQWTSDPVLAVNTSTGAFYFSALGEVPSVNSFIGVVKGRFTGSTFAWGAPSIVRTVNVNSDFLDKEWITVDPADGRVYASYTNFPVAGSEIDFQWADSSLTTWSTFKKLSAVGENGWVQGSRPVVGPNGNVYVVYYRIGTSDVDYFRICRSADRGATFSVPNDAVSFYPNFGTGAPGFNRYLGIQFPSIAVDRSGGPHNGRLYLAWNESLNWFDDWSALVGSHGTAKSEVETGNTAATATPATVGQVLRGTLSSSTDLDYFSVPLTAGQTILVMCDSLTGGVPGPSNSSDYITMRMFATDGTSRLAYTGFGSGDANTQFGPTWLFTAPSAGTYYIRMASNHNTAVNYRLKTGFASRASERGRDQRDVFMSWSDDGGVTWGPPNRVNQDAVGFDDWLPEIAVAPDGEVACAWYDWRNAAAATCGGESSVYLSTSADGGATWNEQGAITDARTAWSSVGTNIAPNQGDYISMYATLDGLAVAWSDGRGGNPDTYMEWIASDRPVLTLAQGVPGRVSLQWYLNRTAGTTAGLYRQVGNSAPFDSIATLTLDAGHHFDYTDTSGVVLGQSYHYKLGIVTNGTEKFYDTANIQIGAPALALSGAWPNPARQDAVIAFTLSADTPATVTLLDLNGRRIWSQHVSGIGQHTLALVQGKRVEPGVYFVKLEQSGRKTTRRIVVV